MAHNVSDIVRAPSGRNAWSLTDHRGRRVTFIAERSAEAHVDFPSVLEHVSAERAAAQPSWQNDLYIESLPEAG